MLISHIPNIIEFYPVPENKYENAITREEYERKLSEESEKEEYGPDANGACRINPKRLLDTENELFAGDKIVGYFVDDENHSLCLYEWKRNNPRSIKAYSLLLPLEEGMLIDDEIQLITARKLNDMAELFGGDKRRKILLTL